MKYFTLIISALLLSTACSKQDQADVPASDMQGIRKDFLNSPDASRPGCYWYWINDNISKEGITKDLEAMARVGIGRAYIGHIYNYRPPTGDSPANLRSQTPLGNVKFMSDAWWEAVQWAVKEAGRVGVEIGFFNSPGWSQSGGPWMKPSQSMRYLAHSETVIKGGRLVDQIVQPPEVTTFPNAGGSRPVQTGPKFTEQDFQDVRLIAFRQPDQEANDLDMSKVDARSEKIAELENLFDKSHESTAYFPGSTELQIDLKLPDPEEIGTGIQSIKIKPEDFGFVLKCNIEASDDGKTYRQIAEYSEQRGHQGPKNTDDIYIPFEETKARYLRLIFNVSKGVRFSELSLSRTALLGYYVRKQMGETSPSTTPEWDAYQWGSQIEPAEGSTLISGEVLDLSDKMDSEGRLKWDAPPGDWVVLRMGMIPIGTQNAPSSPESRGLEVDKMNKNHVDSLFDGMVGEFLRRTPAEEREALKYIIADSYETGPQNWTDGFSDRFESRFGYSPEKYMPVLTGRIVDNPDVSDRFLWDMRRLIVEGIAYDYVGGLREICNDNDLTLWLEDYGHWGFPSEFLLYGSQTNQVGGEFWIGGVSDNIECRAAVSCAHTYGKKSIYAESFTSGQNFQESPSTLKKWCDWVYGVGVNHLILHVYIHQPDERKPGIIQWFGTDFNRHNTWFEQSKGFIDYTRRSSVLLKAGLPVVDVVYYVGEDAPMMQGPMNPDLPDGFNFDFINSDVLINHARGENGKLLVDNGPAYSLLVLPEQEKMRPEVALAIKNLVNQGVVIIGSKPERSPSLENYPVGDDELAQIVDELWGNMLGEKIRKGSFGKGYIYNGLGIDEVFRDLGIEKDISIISDKDIRCAAAGSGHLGIGTNGGIVFNHRKGKDTDIYFLANTSNEVVDFTASLRCSAQKPSLWNAVTGEISDEIAFKQKDGRTMIPLHLEASESIFVVLEGKIGKNKKGAKDSNTPDYTTTVRLDGPWTVEFEEIDSPKQIVFDKLVSWPSHENPDIKSFSGTATYNTTFSLEEINKNQKTILDLGEVGVIATVYVNGTVAGTVWTSPWEVDISDYVIVGRNNLKISVANTWYNRVLADSRLPETERKTYISQEYNFRDQNMQKAGLLGPVTIKRN